MTIRRVVALVAVAGSLSLGFSGVSVGAVLPGGPGVRAVAPVAAVAFDLAAPGVDVTKLVPTSVVVGAAQVGSHPKLAVAATPSKTAWVSPKVLMSPRTSARVDAATGLATFTPAGLSTIPRLGSHVPAACTGTGKDGNRVQVLYVVEAGRVNRFASVAGSLASFAADADDVFALSSAKTNTGRRVRWVQDGACNISVLNVTVPAGSLGTDASTEGAFASMKDALTAAGFVDPTRKYLVFADANAMCGIADLYVDSAKGVNANDGGAAMFARVDSACWSTDWTGGNSGAHELMHTLGAVQPDAPNATPNGHCTDESDEMCYADGSNLPIRTVCPAVQESLFDCGNNDYFNPSVTLNPASYLGTHWNTADSSFLMSVPMGAAAIGISRNPARVSPGGLATLKATVQFGTGPTAVQFYYSTNGAVWSKVGGVLTTGSSGAVSLRVKPAGAGVTARYKAVMVGTSVSAWTTVAVSKYAARASMKGAVGRSSSVSTKLTTSTGLVLKGQRVFLQYRVGGTGSWRTLTYRSTDRSGVVTVPVRPKRGTYYRWYYAGAPTVTGVYSGLVLFR